MDGPRFPWSSLALAAGLALALAALASCGGGGGGTAAGSATYAIGGSVSGLTASGLVLQDNAGDDLTVASGATSFIFATKLADGAAYAVTVKTQPSGLTCSVSSGSGTVTSADVTGVAMVCAATTYSVGGSIRGLTASGLVLQDNAGDNLTVSSGATSYTFATKLADGAAYAVTVKTQPSGLTCSVSSGSGAVSGAAVTAVAIVCATTAYSVGGSVSGLTASGLVLQDNAGDNLTVSSGATSFTFATKLTSAATYAVTVKTQPSGLTCSVTNGSGTVASAAVTTVAVSCATIGWAWISGSKVISAAGSYGTLGQAAASNVPPARQAAVSWTSKDGSTLWLFGGFTTDTGTILNDLWKYDTATGLWTWVAGSSSTNTQGTYGTLGTAASGNVPGARFDSTTWIDTSGNLWLFGGNGYDSRGSRGYLNDVWKFDGTYWVWEAGSDTSNPNPSYPGTVGTGGATYHPGGRQGAAGWIDGSGNLWLLGGSGPLNVDLSGQFNDLWKFNTTSGTWTWVGGSNTRNAKGTYGTLGTASSSNVPGARYLGMTWTDSSGNFWLFGGSGYDSVPLNGDLNDLWKFDGTNWTWESGSNLSSNSTNTVTSAGVLGIYGTLGTAGASNVPGARNSAVSWIDGSGNLWLASGSGYDSVGTGDVVNSTYSQYLNDLWKFDGSQWTWKSGSSTADAAGSYGTLGSAASSNVPGARSNAVSWIDGSGRLWLFGGTGCPESACTTSGDGVLNDLWRYQP